MNWASCDFLLLAMTTVPIPMAKVTTTLLHLLRTIASVHGYEDLTGCLTLIGGSDENFSGGVNFMGEQPIGLSMGEAPTMPA